MTNIREIAKLAGVSVTTVSRVLNNHPYVSDEKRKTVLQVIEETNYQTNLNAVHLSKGKTFLIGVAIPFSNHPYFGSLLEGIASEAVKNNYKLVLFQTNYIKNREMEALNMLKHKQIDALVICSRICEWDVIEEYVTYGPIVFCEDTRGKNVSSTFIDHRKSFQIALEYLYTKGHKDIGYCIGRRTGYNSRQREKAYKNFLKEKNITFDGDFIFDQCFYFEDGERIVAQLRTMENRPSALLVTSDQVAAGIVTTCMDHGIKIPENLALIGFDNQPIAKMMNITTVDIPLFEIGKNLFTQAITSEISYKEFHAILIERDTV